MNEKRINKKVIKIALYGDSGVGKSAINNSFLGINSKDDFLITVGADKSDIKYKVKNNEEIKLIFCEVGGAERFRSVAFAATKGFDGAILIFSLTDKDSFDHLNIWLDQIKENLVKPFIIIFGNKADIDKNQWRVTNEEKNTFVKEKKFAYFETSYITGKGLKEGLSYIVNNIYDKKFGKDKENEDNLDNKEIEINNKEINNSKNKSDCVTNKKNKKGQK